MILLSWIAGRKAAALLYSGSEKKLHLAASELMPWVVYTSLPTLGVIAGIIIMLIAKNEPAYWTNRLFFMPLIVIPLMMLWLSSLPRLRRIKISTGRRSDRPLNARMRFRVTHPGFIVPFHLTTLSSVTAFYLSLSSTVQPRLMHFAIPLALLLLLAIGVWMAYVNRSSKLSLAGLELKNRT